jgi:NTE family protein
MKKNISVILIITAVLFLNNMAFCFDQEAFLQNYLWDKVSSLPASKRPKIILVLGGGGARGLAHIGVIKALEEENIPFDMIVGTSIGALVGSLYCSGVSTNELQNLANNIRWKDISNLNTISMLTLILSEKLLSTKKLENYLRKTLGDKQFFQLDIPFACIATDISTGERIILKEGDVALATRASSTIPGIFAPVEYGQRYLVDGGLVENIPVSVAKLFEPDIIITVSVAADITKNSFSNVMSTLYQAIYIQGQQKDEINLAMSDIVIRPDVKDVSVLDLNKAENCIQSGFVAGKNNVNKIKEIIIKKIYEKHSN